MERRDIPRMYRLLKSHFVLITGTSITQKMLKLVSIAHHNPKDPGCVKAIEVLRECRQALSEQELFCPEIVFVAIFLSTLEPDSAIRDRLQLMVNEAGRSIQLDSVTEVFHTWLRDQEIQRSNESTFLRQFIFFTLHLAICLRMI